MFPPLNLPSTTSLIASKTAVSTRFDRARQDVRAEERLVGVDADPPDAFLLRRVERTEPTAARRPGRSTPDALLDLVERDLPCTSPGRRSPASSRSASVIPGSACLGARLVAGDEAVDGRLLLPADRADHVLARQPLLLEPGEIADEVARPPARGRAGRGRSRACAAPRLVDVDDRELRCAGTFVATVSMAVALGEADADVRS